MPFRPFHRDKIKATSEFPTFSDFLADYGDVAPYEAVYAIVVPGGRDALLRFAEEIQELLLIEDSAEQLQTLNLLVSGHLPSSQNETSAEWLDELLCTAEAILDLDLSLDPPPPPLPTRRPLSARFEDIVISASSDFVWEAPSEDLIFEIVSDVEAGREDFLIIDDRAHGDHYFIQTARSDSGVWDLGQVLGEADLHFVTTTTSKEFVHEALTCWSFGLAPPSGLDWKRSTSGIRHSNDCQTGC
jgi:hypothetical protein